MIFFAVHSPSQGLVTRLIHFQGTACFVFPTEALTTRSEIPYLTDQTPKAMSRPDKHQSGQYSVPLLAIPPNNDCEVDRSEHSTLPNDGVETSDVPSGAAEDQGSADKLSSKKEHQRTRATSSRKFTWAAA
jgi:hypothetical protein